MCYVLIDSYVVDITGFLDQHPGGQMVLLQDGGKDATKDFNIMNHSQKARNQMMSMRIGRLATD